MTGDYTLESAVDAATDNACGLGDDGCRADLLVELDG
jgi:hypothetical protein